MKGRFTYLCDCHDERAEKPAVVAHSDWDHPGKDWKRVGLGKWRCSVTGRSAKVYRKKPKVPETAAPPAPLSDSLVDAIREMGLPMPDGAR